MKDFLHSVCIRVRDLMIEPTSHVMAQAFRALFVGGIAFIVDAGILWAVSLTGLHYLICAVFGFFAGVSVNYKLSVKFVFKRESPDWQMGRGNNLYCYWSYWPRIDCRIYVVFYRGCRTIFHGIKMHSGGACVCVEFHKPQSYFIQREMTE